MQTKYCALGVLIAAVLAGPVLAADQPATAKPATATPATATPVTATPAAAKPASAKPLATLTCEDFIGLDESFQPKVVYWAAAYAKGGAPEGAVLDVDGTETAIPFIAEECRKTPKESFWHKVKAAIKKVEKKM